jgi:hypothetical protein
MQFYTISYYVFPLTSKIFYSLSLRPPSYVQNFLQSFRTTSLLCPKFSTVSPRSFLLRPKFSAVFWYDFPLTSKIFYNLLVRLPSDVQNFLQSLLRPPSYVQIFSSTICSRALSSLCFSLNTNTLFHTHTKPYVK